ncbi:hypothetical protein DLM75_11615 [Leptospira stimsonii]|uniref:Uncharacterized protein n=1 Tax=Leptospira stimsonii TaxID=2202203 RepID=A0A396Z2B6_9LEPT|nr:hypothetical protein DLM75_11615 [Leptospira stimsonii]
MNFEIDRFLILGSILSFSFQSLKKKGSRKVNVQAVTLQKEFGNSDFERSKRMSLDFRGFTRFLEYRNSGI